MLPEDLMIAYQNFTLLAGKHGFVYAGFMMSKAGCVGIGNANQTGHELARLLRDYADILDRHADAGTLPPRTFASPN